MSREKRTNISHFFGNFPECLPVWRVEGFEQRAAQKPAFPPILHLPLFPLNVPLQSVNFLCFSNTERLCFSTEKLEHGLASYAKLSAMLLSLHIESILKYQQRKKESENPMASIRQTRSVLSSGTLRPHKLGLVILACMLLSLVPSDESRAAGGKQTQHPELQDQRSGGASNEVVPGVVVIKFRHSTSIGGNTPAGRSDPTLDALHTHGVSSVIRAFPEAALLDDDAVAAGKVDLSRIHFATIPPIWIPWTWRRDLRPCLRSSMPSRSTLSSGRSPQ